MRSRRPEPISTASPPPCRRRSTRWTAAICRRPASRRRDRRRESAPSPAPCARLPPLRSSRPERPRSSPTDAGSMPACRTPAGPAGAVGRAAGGLRRGIAGVRRRPCGRRGRKVRRSCIAERLIRTTTHRSPPAQAQTTSAQDLEVIHRAAFTAQQGVLQALAAAITLGGLLRRARGSAGDQRRFRPRAHGPRGPGPVIDPGRGHGTPRREPCRGESRRGGSRWTTG